MVDNRRTFCDHCSLRRDLPGFIGVEHADGNITRIKSGDLFPCHMIIDQNNYSAPNRICLGAAVVAGAHLDNGAQGPNRGEVSVTEAVYDTLDDYREAQVKGRVTNQFLIDHGDRWFDSMGRCWFGWWAKAAAGNWRYLTTTLEGNLCESVYLFFDQLEALFGPLAHRKADT